MGPRPRIPELSGTPGLDPEEDQWSRKQRVPPHSLERHAEDHERIEEGPRDPGDHRHDRRFRHRGPHQRGPPREPPRVRRDEGPGHARRALDRDAPGVLEVLSNVSWTGPIQVRPPFCSWQAYFRVLRKWWLRSIESFRLTLRKRGIVLAPHSLSCL